MLDKQKLMVNAVSSVAQILVTGITLFILYRYLLEIIGPAKLGIWSLVLSISSMAQMANLGFSGSIVKYVADYDARGEMDKIVSATQTAVISVAILSICIVFLIYLGAHKYFAYTLSAEDMADANDILPLALLCFWLYMVMSIYHGVLFGFHCITQRNFILSFDSLSHLFLCILLAQKYGLYGLVFARAAQHCITLAISIALLKSRLKNLPIIPHKWSGDSFREMFSFSFKFQIITLLMMFVDPLTKGFISRFGSISMVAYYEMASKLIQLFRSLIVNANQILVPSFARVKQLEPSKINEVFLKSHSIVIFLAILVFGGLAVSAPLISYIWLGHYESIFVVSIIMLSFGWLINTWSVPAYMASVGTGDIQDNLVSHILMTGANIIFIWLIGDVWNGAGVILAWSLSLALGGLLLNSLYYRRRNIAFRELLPVTSRLLVLSVITALLFSILIWIEQETVLLVIANNYPDFGYSSQLAAGVLMIIFFVVFTVWPAWNHPVRRQLCNIVFNSNQ